MGYEVLRGAGIFKVSRFFFFFIRGIWELERVGKDKTLGLHGWFMAGMESGCVGEIAVLCFGGAMFFFSFFFLLECILECLFWGDD